MSARTPATWPAEVYDWNGPLVTQRLQARSVDCIAIVVPRILVQKFAALAQVVKHACRDHLVAGYAPAPDLEPRVVAECGIELDKGVRDRVFPARRRAIQDDAGRHHAPTRAATVRAWSARATAAASRLSTA